MLIKSWIVEHYLAPLYANHGGTLRLTKRVRRLIDVDDLKEKETTAFGVEALKIIDHNGKQRNIEISMTLIDICDTTITLQKSHKHLSIFDNGLFNELKVELDIRFSDFADKLRNISALVPRELLDLDDTKYFVSLDTDPPFIGTESIRLAC